MSYLTMVISQVIKHEAVIDAEQDFNNDSIELYKHTCRFLKGNMKLIAMYEKNYDLKRDFLERNKS